MLPRQERIHGVHQDRLIKKLRRKKIASYEAANGISHSICRSTIDALPGRRPSRRIITGGNPRLANASDFPTGDRTHDQQLLGGAARQPIFPGESSSPAVCSGQGQSHGVRMGGGALQIRYRGRAVVWEEIPGPVPVPPARPREATGKKQKPPTPKRITLAAVLSQDAPLEQTRNTARVVDPCNVRLR